MSLKISLIAAMAANRVIGRNNGLPWHLSADLRRFKEITMGKAILMGRKTHESIGRPLPGRTNIVLTRDRGYTATGCIVVASPEQAIAAIGGKEELIVIGGASLYERFLPLADRLYVTLIDASFEGDTFFPPWAGEEWNEIERIDITDDASVRFAYHFIVLERTVRREADHDEK